VKWVLLWVSIMPNETTWTNSTGMYFDTAVQCEQRGLDLYLEKLKGMDGTNEQAKSLPNRIRVPLLQFTIKDTWSCIPKLEK